MKGKAMQRTIKRFLWVWLALMVLLALTCGSAFLRMGMWNSTTNLAIAMMKAALVGFFFMHLGKAHGTVRLCASVALFALALLFLISASDYATRVIHWAPWEAAG
jgi:cytochrome c oxidase subunit 4